MTITKTNLAYCNTALRVLLFTCTLLLTIPAFSQCPANEAALAAGGTFSGNCSIAVGGDVQITGTVNWTSGTLDITGTGGNLLVMSGGAFNVNGGSVLVNDGGDGRIEVRAGGTMTVAAGATVTAATLIEVWGGLTISGTVQSQGATFKLWGAASSITVNSGGSFLTPNGNGDNIVQGNLTVAGTLTTGGNLDINGGAAVFQSGATANIGTLDGVAPPADTDDITVFGGGSLTIESGATVNVDDDVIVGVAPSSAGTITVDGTLNVADDIVVVDTEPSESSITSSSTGGIVNATGTITDGECNDSNNGNYASGSFTFCDCTGGGVPCNAVLPIELAAFTAEYLEGKVQLKWSTASETNNDYFIVEKSINGEIFDAIATIQGAGNSNYIRSYNYTDKNINTQANYYRLKQVDIDGKSTYSKVIAVFTDYMGSLSEVYPNPLNLDEGKDLVIHISEFIEGADYNISVISNTGTVAYRESGVAEQSMLSINLSQANNIAPGTYLLIINYQNTIRKERLYIQ